VGVKTEKTFKSILGKAGYSEKAQGEVWKWYRTPTKKRKAHKKRPRMSSPDFWKLHDAMYEEGPPTRYNDPDKWQPN
jgi:hypothetical protein